MDCQEARLHLLDSQRGRLPADLQAGLRAHLDACAVCSRVDAEEQVVTEILERRLPQHSASIALKRRLAAQWPATPVPTRSWWSRWAASLVPALVVAVVLVVALPVYFKRTNVARTDATATMVREAVNDYLRLLSSQQPVEIASGGIHQVKPWFEGRLDFAPVVSFEGDQDFPLKGGSVGYFLDRKAAVFVYGRRLHTIALFVFRADGLPWPTQGLQAMGTARASVTVDRGFNVLLWRAGDLGYALVSDLDAGELRELGARFTRGT
jgi:anti-sigma factor RsiW